MLYERLLKGDFERLPRALREFHSPHGGRASGRASVRHASLLARLLGFPPPGDDIAMELEVTVDEDREIWIRWFGDQVRRSVQWQEGELFVETMGPVRVWFRIGGDETGMWFRSERARLWIFPLPVRVEAIVHGGESSWTFEVSIAYIASYRGVMFVKL